MCGNPDSLSPYLAAKKHCSNRLIMDRKLQNEEQNIHGGSQEVELNSFVAETVFHKYYRKSSSMYLKCLVNHSKNDDIKLKYQWEYFFGLTKKGL